MVEQRVGKLLELQPKIRILNRIHQSIRLKNYAISIEKAHVYGIKRFVLFHNKQGQGYSSLIIDMSVSKMKITK